MELECKGYIKRENRVFSFFKKYWVNVITVVLCVACCFVSITQTKGIQGEQGIQGLQGIQGERGEQGERGADGVNGKDGVDGKDGKDGVDGINGKDGKNGLTPYIGENGNWWIGHIDTGYKVTNNPPSSPLEKDGLFIEGEWVETDTGSFDWNRVQEGDYVEDFDFYCRGLSTSGGVFDHQVANSGWTFTIMLLGQDIPPNTWYRVSGRVDTIARTDITSTIICIYPTAITTK